MTRKHRALVKPERPKPKPVVVQSMDARVWQVALRLAKGDTSRIDRINSTEVIVRNPKPPEISGKVR